jgi:hypothetical protein
MERMIRLALPCFLTHRALIVPTLSLSLSHQFLCLHTRAFGARVCVCTCHSSIPFPVPVGGLIVRESTHARTRATVLAQRVRSMGDEEP